MRKGLLYCLGAMLVLCGGGVRAQWLGNEIYKGNVKYRVTKLPPDGEVEVMPFFEFFGLANKYSGELIIPKRIIVENKQFWSKKKYEKYAVTGLGNKAFYGCPNLIELTLPSSLVSIGNEAFSGCSGLTDLALPSSLASIGDKVFRGCSGLTSLMLPPSLASIGSGAFDECKNLRELSVEADNSHYESEGGVLFNKGKTELVRVPEGYPDAIYNVPSTVTSIKERAFYACSGLAHLVLSSSLTSIGDGAFSACSNLLTVYVPAQIPPTLSGDPKLLSNATLYVPGAKYADYLVSDDWRDYKPQMKKCFRVSFDADGGTLDGKAEQIVGEDVFVTRPADPIKAGYTFVEWRESGVKFDFTTMLAASDITLKAIWKSNAKSPVDPAPPQGNKSQKSPGKPEQKPEDSTPVELPTPQLRISPLPTSDFLTLEGMTEPTTVRVYNPLGQLLLTKSVAPGAPVDVRQLEAGVYLLEVQGQTVRFVKR